MKITAGRAVADAPEHHELARIRVQLYGRPNGPDCGCCGMLTSRRAHFESVQSYSVLLVIDRRCQPALSYFLRLRHCIFERAYRKGAHNVAMSYWTERLWKIHNTCAGLLVNVGRDAGGCAK